MKKEDFAGLADLYSDINPEDLPRYLMRNALKPSKLAIEELPASLREQIEAQMDTSDYSLGEYKEGDAE